MSIYNIYKHLKICFDPTVLKNKSYIKKKHPVNLKAARRIGYKNKPGFHVFNVKIKKGNRVTKPANARRRTKAHAPRKTLKQSCQRIAENRVARKYKPLQLLNSYKLYEKADRNYFEVILYDPVYIKLTPKQLPGRSFRGISASCKN